MKIITTGKRKLAKSVIKNKTTAYAIYINTLAPGGRKGMASVLNTACRYVGWQKVAAQYPWHRLRYQDVQTMRAGMLEDGYAINSVNLALSGMRSIAKTAFNMEVMDGERLMRIQSVQPVKGEVLRRGRSLSGIEIRAVINNCHQRSKQKQHTVRAVRDKALFVLACTAGLRSAELRSLTVDCFDSHVGCIRVRNAKGRKQREIHLCSLARHALKPWLVLLGKSHGALFRPVSQTGNIQSQRLSATGLSSIFRQLQSDSGIEPFSPHDLRRTFITQLLQNGEDINTVRQLAGHSAITTTAGYDYRDARTVCAASRRLRFSSSPTLTI